MREVVEKLLEICQGMWRYRWPALALAWVLAILGWVAVIALPDVYQARAKVYVDTDTVLRPLLRGLAAETDVMTQVNMMSRALLTQPQLEQVAQSTDLYLRAKGPKELERLLDQLRAKITIQVVPQNKNLYSISYEDHDRSMSVRVVQKLLDSFMENTIGVNRQDSSNAQRFLEGQIAEYERRLAEAEQRLAQFKQGNVGMMPSDKGGYYERLQAAVIELEGLRGEHQLALERHHTLQRQIEGEEPTFGLMSSAAEVQSPLTAQINEHRRRLDALLLQYTEKHPDVLALRERIAALEEQKRKEARPAIPSAASATELVALNTLDVNPVYQQLQIRLNDAEIEVTESAGKLRRAEADVAKLRAAVDTIPEVEAQLAQLNRDYEVNRTQHAELLRRLESARLSDQVEQSRDDVKFRILEPPLVPIAPVGPPRALFMSAVLVAALAAGLGLAFLLNQIHPVFLTRQGLATRTGREVLGAISLALSPPQLATERRGNVRFAVAGVLLVVAFVGVVMAAPTVGAILRGAQGAAA